MNESHGPSDDTLQFLNVNLKNMAEGVAHGKLTGRGGVSNPVQRIPTKFCVICGTMWAAKYTTKPPQEAVCSDCQMKLNDGFTACVGPDASGHNRFAFCKFPDNHEVSGKLLKVSAAQMAAIAKRFEDEWKIKTEDKPDEQPPV